MKALPPAVPPVVNYPHATYDGLTEGKIDAAYAFAYNESLDQTDDSHMTQARRYLAANQAGQLFEVQTVESVTGVHIDHFIDSDIIGFYELAQQFGGLEICIQPAPAQGGLSAGANLTDDDPLTGTDNSGFNRTATATTARRAASSTCTCPRRSRWPTSVRATPCRGLTSAAPPGSRPPSSTSCGS